MQSSAPSKKPVNKKSRARNLAVQGLYQTLVLGAKPDDTDALIASIVESAGNPPHDKALLKTLVEGVFFRQADLEALISGHLSEKWKQENMSAVLRAILLCACFELMVMEETPLKAIITEYLHVTDLYFDPPERKFVNGMLDAIAKELRK